MPLGFLFPAATKQYFIAPGIEVSDLADNDRRIMGKQSQNKFKKRQREFERKRKAKEKMDRRQGKKPNEVEDAATEPLDVAAETDQA
jgi:hypothetical protein